MKKSISFAVLFILLCSTSIPAQAQNNCATITYFDVPPVVQQELYPGSGYTLASFTVAYTTSGNSTKTIEISVNGSSSFYVVSGAGVISSDRLIPLGVPMVVTLTTFTSHKPNRGNECGTQTKIGPVL